MIPPTLAILLSPFATVFTFLRFDVRVALCVSIIGSYLLLPVKTGIDLPMLPALNKHSLPPLAALIYLLIRYSGSDNGTSQKTTDIVPGWLPKSGIGRLLLFIVITSPFLTVMTNGDGVNVGGRILQALRPYDAVADVFTTLLTLLPLLLARKFLASEEGHRTLLIVLAMAGFFYSFLAGYEARMSPHLNEMFYGFRPSSWRQHLRNGGFRPMVFLHHGLWVGIFLSASVLAGLSCFRFMPGQRKAFYLMVGLWTFCMLFVSKTFGAFMITFFLAPVVLFMAVRLQLVIAMLLAGVVLVYPMMRGADLIPVDWVVSKVAESEPVRARSLQFRLNNEDIMLEKSNDRPLFGWGGWGRSRVYDENGRDISTLDGSWIIVISEQGWYGYIGTFGLMALPILLLTLRKRKYEVTVATSCLCLVLVSNMIDLIANGTLTVVTWLVAGALLGRLELEHINKAVPTPETTPVSGARDRSGQAARPLQPDGSRPSQPGYTRFPKTHPRSTNSRI